VTPAGRSSGTCTSTVQMPCKSGSPHGVRRAAVLAGAGAHPLTSTMVIDASAITAAIPINCNNRSLISRLLRYPLRVRNSPARRVKRSAGPGIWVGCRHSIPKADTIERMELEFSTLSRWPSSDTCKNYDRLTGLFTNLVDGLGDDEHNRMTSSS